MRDEPKRKRSSKVIEYSYVYYREYDRGSKSDKPYNGRFTLNSTSYDCGWYQTAKQAARAVDLQLIRLGKEPINVLKRI